MHAGRGRCRYFNSNSASSVNVDGDVPHQMQTLVQRDAFHYVLHPTSGSLGLVLNQSTVTPRVELRRLLEKNTDTEAWVEQVNALVLGAEGIGGGADGIDSDEDEDDMLEELQDDPLRFFIDRWYEGDTHPNADRGAFPPDPTVSPLRYELHRRGLLTPYMVHLVEEFETEASRKAPGVDVAVALGTVRFTLSDAQYTDLMWVLGLLSVGPAPPRGVLPVSIPNDAAAQRTLYKRVWFQRGVQKATLDTNELMAQLLLEQALMEAHDAVFVQVARREVEREAAEERDRQRGLLSRAWGYISGGGGDHEPLPTSTQLYSDLNSAIGYDESSGGGGGGGGGSGGGSGSGGEPVYGGPTSVWAKASASGVSELNMRLQFTLASGSLELLQAPALSAPIPHGERVWVSAVGGGTGAFSGVIQREGGVVRTPPQQDVPRPRLRPTSHGHGHARTSSRHKLSSLVGSMGGGDGGVPGRTAPYHPDWSGDAQTSPGTMVLAVDLTDWVVGVEMYTEDAETKCAPMKVSLSLQDFCVYDTVTRASSGPNGTPELFYMVLRQGATPSRVLLPRDSRGGAGGSGFAAGAGAGAGSASAGNSGAGMAKDASMASLKAGGGGGGLGKWRRDASAASLSSVNFRSVTSLRMVAEATQHLPLVQLNLVMGAPGCDMGTTVLLEASVCVCSSVHVA